MRIDRLTSSDFRNLIHEPLSFSPGVNLVVGENGHGKTNVLEAIYFFKFGRSFRTSRDSELIRFEEPLLRIVIEAETRVDDREAFEAAIERKGAKRIKLNGKEVPKYSELVGRYPCVLFGPHDLALTSGQPAERRRFLDMVGSLTDPGYLAVLRAYRRVLAQRNAALKTDTASALGVWTEELIEQGCHLVRRRVDVVEAIRKHMISHIEKLQVRYPIRVGYESELTNSQPADVTHQEHFAARLAGREFDEIRRGTTLVGPHRDDMTLVVDGHDLRRYGSQGQRRLVAVLLRLAELSYVEEQLREPCVLLLDDLFSELDERVVDHLKGALDDNRQIFVTSPVDLSWDAAGTQIFRVNHGQVGPVPQP
ncbi:MAG: DNA replication/repair protein RecF [Candidatus Krumholzibacteria bacterium]|nr:DNA replication/repair protein RecF [Candidatus Krumholzibacteria bacterium]